MSRNGLRFSDYLFVIFLFVVGAVILFGIFYRGPDYKEKYEELYDEYLELESKYESAMSSYYDNDDVGYQLDRIYEKVGSLEDDLVTVSSYFENENDVSFDEARESYDRIDSVLYSLFFN